MLWPREAGKFISENAKHVSISSDGIEKAASEIFTATKAGKLNLEEFKQVCVVYVEVAAVAMLG